MKFKFSKVAEEEHYTIPCLLFPSNICVEFGHFKIRLQTVSSSASNSARSENKAVLSFLPLSLSLVGERQQITP